MLIVVTTNKLSAPEAHKAWLTFALSARPVFHSRFTDGTFHSFGGPGDDLSGCIHRIIDLEEQDKETIHLLIHMLMQFMSRPDQAFPSDEKPVSKVQGIVLRHLYLLLGYNSAEKFFHVTPARMRTSTVFNSFLANLPQLLDQNHLMGGTMLPVVLQVLLYAPNPNSNVLPSAESMQNASYTYSLWSLEPHVRRNWLMAVIVLMYKYQYNYPPFSQNINSLVRIVLNSLDCHFHQCKRIPATVVMDIVPTRSRDVSQPSLGPDSDKGFDSPPTSPIFKGEATSSSNNNNNNINSNGNNLSRPKPSFLNKGGNRKYADSSLEQDDTESELVAIPESDFSDSTLHGGSSAPGSFDDPTHFEDVCLPLKTEVLKSRAIAQVTTANSPLDKPEETFTKKTQKTTTTITTTNGDNVRKTTTIETTTVKTQPMTATEKAVHNPPANVQRAIVITQNPNSQSEAAATTTTTTTTVRSSPEPPLLSWVEQKISSPVPRPLGRQKRIIEANITPASSPNSLTEQNSPSGQTEKLRRTFKSFDSNHEYGSPESPLSKMHLMSPPLSDHHPVDELLSPKSVQQLEIPTLERLLPIGQPGKEGIAALAERVREALTIPNISHLKQDSLEATSDSSAKEDTGSLQQQQQLSSRSNSPRKLIKQSALIDSPPHNHQHADDLHTSMLRAVLSENKEKSPLRGHRNVATARKVGPFAVDSIQIPDSRLKYAGSWQPANFKPDDSDPEDDDNSQQHVSAVSDVRPPPLMPTSTTADDTTVVDRCSECFRIREEYSDEEVGILVIILGTFIHREPQLAAPFMPEILLTVSKFATQFTFPWQCESSTHLPGGSQSVAHQFIRCVLHQLAPNGVFIQIFLTQAHGKFLPACCLSIR